MQNLKLLLSVEHSSESVNTDSSCPDGTHMQYGGSSCLVKEVCLEFLMSHCGFTTLHQSLSFSGLPFHHELMKIKLNFPAGSSKGNQSAPKPQES